MKRDLDLMRRILQACEEHPHGFAPRDLALSGCTKEQIGYHIHLLGQAGLMRVSDVTSFDNASPQALPIALTNAGHDFLDATRDPTRWERVRSVVATLGGWTLDVVRDIAVQLLRDQATRVMTTGSP
ncbi:MAG: DUF2513 domain-containing protein [Phycisphaerales bacterium]